MVDFCEEFLRRRCLLMIKLLEDSIPSTEPFDAVAATYDDTFSNSSIGRVQRRLVWMETDRNFRAGQRILEINCGTGIDALHLATRGIEVMACDSAAGMIAVARRRLAESSSIRAAIDFRCLPTEQIAQIENGRPYDGILSNFAGLNCLSDLNTAADDFSRLVRPGGSMILCLFGRLCLWEIFYYLARCDFGKASRRFRGKAVVVTLSPGSKVIVRYPSIRSLQRAFSRHFRLKNWKGVGVMVPPSYLERLAVRLPRFFELAAEIDPWLGRCPGVRALADHVVLTFERSSS
jgi:ubiquinone/menaquinone biosynthesis C-methylase UbiE